MDNDELDRLTKLYFGNQKIFELMVKFKTEMQLTLRDDLTEEECNEILLNVKNDRIIQKMAFIALKKINSIGPNMQEYWYAVTKASSVILYELGFEEYKTATGHLKFYKRVEFTKIFA